MALTQEEIIRTLLGARSRLVAAAWLVVRDAHVAEDIFQSMTIKAIDGRSEFEREAALISWAFVTTRHEALRSVRDRRHRAVVLESSALDLLDAEWAQGSSGALRDRIDALEQCLGELPEDARRLVELRYYDQRSCSEVASVLRLGLQAVYQRLSRLHRALRSCVEGRLAAGSGHLSQEAT
jgi:RNA polymerase sigma-70 factor (ECF subfamily)